MEVYYLANVDFPKYGEYLGHLYFIFYRHGVNGCISNRVIMRVSSVFPFLDL